MRMQKTMWLLLVSLGLSGCPTDTVYHLYNNTDKAVQVVLLERTVAVPSNTSVTIGGQSGEINLSELPRGGDPRIRSWSILKIQSGDDIFSHDLIFDESTSDYVLEERQGRKIWLQLDRFDRLFLVIPGVEIPTTNSAMKYEVKDGLK